MQLVLKASYNSAQLGVDDIGDGTALVVENGVARLLYVDETVNKAYSTSLGTLSAPGSGYMTPDLLADSAEWTLIQPNGGMAFEQTGGQTRAYIYGSHTGALTMTMLGTTGAPGTATIVGTSNGTLSGIETFSVIERSASDLAVLTKWNTPGLTIYEVSSTDRQLHEEDSRTQARLTRVLDDYAAWMTLLPEDDRRDRKSVV